MTVKELKDRLDDFPDDMRVMSHHDETDRYSDMSSGSVTDTEIVLDGSNGSFGGPHIDTESRDSAIRQYNDGYRTIGEPEEFFKDKKVIKAVVIY